MGKSDIIIGKFTGLFKFFNPQSASQKEANILSAFIMSLSKDMSVTALFFWTSFAAGYIRLNFRVNCPLDVEVRGV